MAFNVFNKGFKRDCERIESLLWQYTSGRLDASESAQVETHLHACAVCRTHLQAYQRTWQGVEALRAIPVPTSETSWNAVRERLAAAQTQPVRAGTSGFVGVRRALAWGGALTTAGVAFLWIMTLRVQDTGGADTAVASSKSVKVQGKYASGEMEKMFVAVPLPSGQAALSVLQTGLASAKVTALPPAEDAITDRRFARRTGRLHPAKYVPHGRHLRWTRLAKNTLRRNVRTQIASARKLNQHIPVGVGLQTPDYVLSAVRLDNSQRPVRDFVMDCVLPEDLQAAAENSDGNDQETRVW